MNLAREVDPTAGGLERVRPRRGRDVSALSHVPQLRGGRQSCRSDDGGRSIALAHVVESAIGIANKRKALLRATASASATDAAAQVGRRAAHAIATAPPDSEAEATIAPLLPLATNGREPWSASPEAATNNCSPWWTQRERTPSIEAPRATNMCPSNEGDGVRYVGSPAPGNP